MNRYLVAPLAAFCLNWSGAALSADFVAVRIEAENFTSKSDRWALTTPDYTPDLGPDPDPPHNDSASGKANLELLPDTRVTHDDEVFNGGPDGNFWGGPGGGPRIDYNVDVPEAGRYFVYVKTFSTNTEDNGIHVAVNGTLPESGKRMQICSKHNWFWTSGQRTDENHCGVTKTIWLDFPAAGVNTVTFFAREDGFELDQFLLLKETHDGSLDCYPMFNDAIRCKDIATGATQSDTVVPISQTVDGNTVTTPPAPEPEPNIVDLDIDLNALGTTHFVNDTIEYRVTVTNQNAQNTASNTTAIIELPTALVFNASADCTSNNAEVSCALGDVSPNETNTLSFTASVLSPGNHRADAQVSADEDDSNSSNNIDSATVNAQINVPDYEAGISLTQDSNASAIGGINQYTATISNNGQLDITNATLRVTGGNGISPQVCTPDCTVPTIMSGESTTVAFSTVSALSGVFDVTAELVVIDDANPANNIATLTETVVDTAVAVKSGTDNRLIVIEAESFSSSSVAATENAAQWFIVNDDFTSLPQPLDPDNASHQDVSGSAYIESLPDRRIDDNDANIAGVSNIAEGGFGATLSYKVFFSEPGTYNVYARVRSNNSQDASLHIGLDNNWPATSSAVTVCNPDGNWQWTNNLGNDVGCNTASAATIAVITPGVHELMISQNTDGTELDKLILSLDTVSDLQGNGPVAASIDPSLQADISVDTALAQDKIAVGDSTDLTVTVSNTGNSNASGLTVTINGLGDDAYKSGDFDSCTYIGNSTICSISEISASQQAAGTFSVDGNQTETRSLATTVSAIQVDPNTDNNQAQVTLIAEDASQSNKVTSTGGGSLSLWFLLTSLLLLVFQFFARAQIVEPATSSVE